MPLTFKLVGNVDSKLLEIKQNITGMICLSTIISNFELLGMSPDDFKHIKIVHNSQTLNNDEKVLLYLKQMIQLFLYFRLLKK